MQQNFVTYAQQRGYIHQMTDEDHIINLLSTQQSVPCYIGFDATASSLHIGSLLPIMLLRSYQKMGHKPIILMGGGTTKVGDPSGKDATRQLLTSDDIDRNIESIKHVFSRFLSFGSQPHDAVIINNADWLDHLNYIEFLRDYGRHFSVNRMMQMDSVRVRLERESHLSFLEFNYMLLQSYDFYQLHQHHGCMIQMGGSDQWGNIVMGVDLIRKLCNTQVYGITTPLLTTASGAKMGKTQQGAIWLNHDKITAYDYWQFWRNCEDADTIKFMKLYTDMSLEDIEPFAQLDGADINQAKIRLANEVTSLNFDKDQAQQAYETAQKVFIEGSIGEDLPFFVLTTESVGLLKALCMLGFAQSNSEARRFVHDRAVKINDHVCQDPTSEISQEDIKNAPLKITVGKKKIGLIKQHG